MVDTPLSILSFPVDIKYGYTDKTKYLNYRCIKRLLVPKS